MVWLRHIVSGRGCSDRNESSDTESRDEQPIARRKCRFSPQIVQETPSKFLSPYARPLVTHTRKAEMIQVSSQQR